MEGVFAVFGGVLVVALGFVAANVRETKGVELERVAEEWKVKGWKEYGQWVKENLMGGSKDRDGAASQKGREGEQDAGSTDDIDNEEKHDIEMQDIGRHK